MQIIVADTLKIYDTIKHLGIDVILWHSKHSSLFDICDNDDNDNIAYLIAHDEALCKPSTKSCLEDFPNIQIIQQDDIVQGVDTLNIEKLSNDIEISGQYILYIHEDGSEQSRKYLSHFTNEECGYNVRIVGPVSIKNYKYIGNVNGEELLLLIKHSDGCINFSNSHIYDIAYLEKKCITPVENALFTHDLEFSKVAKKDLSTLIDNIKKVLNINDSSK